MHTLYRIFTRPLVALLVMLALPTLAATASDSDTNKEVIGMVTGSQSGTYIKIGRDIARIAKRTGVDVDVKASKGSLKNILRMASKENAGFGIVQSDILSYLRFSGDADNKKLADRLRLMAPLYKEEVHVFAKKSIQSLADLDGKRVAVGSEGGGSWLTAVTLFDYANIHPVIEYTSKGDAAQAVLQGDLDAMIFVAGKPVSFFTNLGKLKSHYPEEFNNVHFLEIDPDSFTRKLPYVKSTIGPEDYPWLDKKVTTAAVKALLVAFDFSARISPYYAKRCRQFAKVGSALRNTIDYLKQTGHSKWQEVDLYADVGDWPKDPCTWRLANPGHTGSQPITGNIDSCSQIEDMMKRNICRIEQGQD
ncbi:MAG: hypothetical protein CSB48_01220 [Proteobacteria bacterium]|nr:MAG: hypothetical protein CSB48_01220 [Pseudomonadota bacterium]